MIAVQRRSGLRHLVHPDGIATYCGRILHRGSWRLTRQRVCDCRLCLKGRMAEARRAADARANLPA